MAGRYESGNTVACPEHPYADLVEDSHAGDVICRECGLVVGDRVIDVTQEWRFTGGCGGNGMGEKDINNPTRVGDGGDDLTTKIEAVPLGAAKIQINLRKTKTPVNPLVKAAHEIATIADKLHVPKGIVDKANDIYKLVYNGKALKGRRTGSVLAACLYIACRQEEVPRSFKEVCAVSGRPVKEIGKYYKIIVRTLKMSLDVVTTGDFMSRFCAILGLSMSIQRAATCIAKRADEFDIVGGRNPTSVTAAAIYMASQASSDKKTHKEIGDVAGVAEVTIRQAYCLMYPRAIDLFPEDFKFHTPIEHLPRY